MNKQNRPGEQTITDDILKMEFDLNTITHLGAQLYSSLPPVIGELVSNSFDAEAEVVTITINRDLKQIKVSDDGHGMSFSELNTHFLRIGRNRRTDNTTGWSKNNLRKVTGRKGLGKLAIFGIADEITVTTVCNGLKNSFEINYNKIKQISSHERYYKPDILIKDQVTSETDGTEVVISNIRLKTITHTIYLARSLSSKFEFFDKNFNVHIKDKEMDVTVTNELFIEKLNIDQEWTFPTDFPEDKFDWLRTKNVNGKIFTCNTPLKSEDRGFILYARGKLVQERSFFNDRSNDFFNNYVLGHFNIDFVDEKNEDFISTDRSSLFWENDDELIKLKSELDSLVRYIQTKWRKYREKEMTTQVTSILDKDFYDELNKQEKTMVENITRSLVKDFSQNNNPSK
ncbi:ATP-binding protein [Halobacillus mangrovi]|uniref:ATP-binding protein n=1 Tax=Halobacillus mangrovi TaxID=402384 RepID=UPI003D95E26D